MFLPVLYTYINMYHLMLYCNCGLFLLTLSLFLMCVFLLFLLQIAQLQASYEKSVAEQEELTKNINQTQARLKRASKLTTGLADEQVRWAESVKVRRERGREREEKEEEKNDHVHCVYYLLFYRNWRKRLIMLLVMFLWQLLVWHIMEPLLHLTEKR